MIQIYWIGFQDIKLLSGGNTCKLDEEGNSDHYTPSEQSSVIINLWLRTCNDTVAVFHAARESIPLDPGYSRWAPTLSITSNPK